MNHVPLNVYLIETPASRRSLPIIEMLQNDIEINLIRVPAQMVKTPADLLKYKINVNRQSFHIVEGRELNLGEIGCAASHNFVRKLLSESLTGGVILEDDARIGNLKIFKEISHAFLQKKYGTKSILSLTGMSPNDLSSGNYDGTKISWSRVFGNTPLAVANVMTPLAADELLRFNTPVRHVADWPYSRCNFHTITFPIVSHGDGNTQSTIDASASGARNRPSINSQIRRLFFLPLISSRDPSISFREFMNWVYFRRISYRINLFLSTLSANRKKWLNI